LIAKFAGWGLPENGRSPEGSLRRVGGNEASEFLQITPGNYEKFGEFGG
jgi:hypothetical protein